MKKPRLNLQRVCAAVLTGGLALIGNSLLAAAVSVAASSTDLRADSASLDGKTGEYLYRGNALLSQDNVQIRADEMQATQHENGNLKSGRFRGEPAILEHTDPITGATSEARAREIFYDTDSGRIELSGDASLIQRDAKTNREMRLQAAQIQLTETGDQLNDLAATGNPAIFSRREGDAQPIEGQANQLRYLGSKEYLYLEGSAKLIQGKTTFEHSVIEYDGQRKLTTAPKRDGEQVKITRVQENVAPKTDTATKDQPKKDNP
ncbi:hypothetical protein HPT27_18570 [Permianibacter sp. IMCC34836]|uniref:LptA/OstA family protein n=1 Tax=Permianibacter fluminis TaxID=2738515 RepID=UPI00155358E1|nr:LptA/OstA family protein [Permianibacter fluminis]NQD39025.1 hypothetical protein [Permianibacter fluminis]